MGVAAIVKGTARALEKKNGVHLHGAPS